MKFRLILAFTLLLSIMILSVNAQFVRQNVQSNEFYFDATVFQSQENVAGRVDLYAMIPYETLEFKKSGDVYGAQFTIIFHIGDSTGKRIDSKTIDRYISETDYFKSQGGAGDFEPITVSFHLPEGKYGIDAMLTDKYSKKEYARSRVVNVLDFNSYDFSLSGILLVSSIEDTGGKYKITPHISDNVGMLKDGFFAFFESYSKSMIDKVGLLYEVTNEANELIYRSESKFVSISEGAKRHYLRVNLPPDTKSGSYILKVVAHKADMKTEPNIEDLLAIGQRSIKVFRTVAGTAVVDFDKALKQLRYAATSSEIDFISAGATIDDKLKRFEEFWEKRDPSPRTTRNEAFEEYYGRIAYANANFRGHTDGWMTDKGMVFVIFGKPMNIERGSPYNDGRIYEKWIYSGNRDYLFVDNSGFGDFRLIAPRLVAEKYEYKR